MRREKIKLNFYLISLNVGYFERGERQNERRVKTELPCSDLYDACVPIRTILTYAMYDMPQHHFRFTENCRLFDRVECGAANTYGFYYGISLVTHR